MRLLLDTHAFIWFITDHPKLNAEANELIEDGRNEVLISIASLWEIAIKMSLGKLTLTASFEELIPRQLFENDIVLLHIEISHLQQLTRLPFHHRDPFDRLLIAQSLAANLPILSRDPLFDAYAVQRIMA